ncbi:MAG: PrsW family intramembrane metalloprotease [Anaerolineae bacterium]|nr:PrsW family intramembrane metalloprotease [Anaerolineae bacterium]
MTQPPFSTRTYAICPRCGQHNRADEPRCLFCGTPLRRADDDERLSIRACHRCGQTLPITAVSCSRCGALQKRIDPAQIPSPAKPNRLAQVGFVLLAVFGGLLILGGLGFGLLALLGGHSAGEGALALAVLAVGIGLLWHAVYALVDPAGLTAALWPAWVWIALLVIIWVPGSLAVLILPRLAHCFLSPLIVLAALFASLTFVATAIRGLRKPAERQPISGKLGPRHAAYISGALSAVFATGMALILETIAIAIIAGLMIAAAYAMGDTVTYERLIRLAESPDLIDQLENLIGTSPIIFAGLVGILSIAAPLIEETLKGLPLLLFAFRLRLSERSMILLGVAGGMGFAFAENIGYLSMVPEAWPLMVVFRTCAAMMHGASSGFVGRGWHRALRRGQWLKALLDFGLAVGIHAGWNLLAVIIVWFGYKGMAEGILFIIAVGLFPLAVMFLLLARWGIWVSET